VINLLKGGMLSGVTGKISIWKILDKEHEIRASLVVSINVCFFFFFGGYTGAGILT
jgi:hypothetical protein